MARLPLYHVARRVANPLADRLIGREPWLTRPGMRSRFGAGTMPLADGTTWKAGEHVTIYGMTGSGKTALVKALILHWTRHLPHANVYILDTKKDEKDYGGWPGIVKSERAPRVWREGGGHIQVWRPLGADKPMRDAVSEWLRAILRAHKASLVVINDLGDIAPAPNSAPEGLPELLKDGRSFGISVVNLTQEKAYTPRTVSGQITYAVRMLMNDPYDATWVARLQGTPRDVPVTQPVKFAFSTARLDIAPRIIHNWHSYSEWP